MKEITAEQISAAVAKLAVEATHFLPEDVEDATRNARTKEAVL